MERELRASYEIFTESVDALLVDARATKKSDAVDLQKTLFEGAPEELFSMLFNERKELLPSQMRGEGEGPAVTVRDIVSCKDPHPVQVQARYPVVKAIQDP